MWKTLKMEKRRKTFQKIKKQKHEKQKQTSVSQ